MNSKKIVWVLAAISAFILLGVGTWLVVSNVTNQPAVASVEAQVHITDEGFVPTELTVAPGTRVVWVNDTATPHRVAAAPYPERTQLPELDSATIAPGESYVFTFQNKGTFDYADYTAPTVNGSIQVK